VTHDPDGCHIVLSRETYEALRRATDPRLRKDDQGRYLDPDPRHVDEDPDPRVPSWEDQRRRATQGGPNWSCLVALFLGLAAWMLAAAIVFAIASRLVPR
jgi:hypothetical protein